MLERLNALERFKYNQLREKMLQHALDWNKNNKCNCVKKINNPTLENMIVCKHIEKDRVNKFYNEIKDGYKKTLIISKLELINILKSTQAKS